jgi:hypothetical protein
MNDMLKGVFRQPESADEKPVMCGGCGTTDPKNRCIGCLHTFYPKLESRDEPTPANL